MGASASIFDDCALLGIDDVKKYVGEENFDLAFYTQAVGGASITPRQLKLIIDNKKTIDRGEPPFPIYGAKICEFQNFIIECGEHEIVNLTTAGVCDKFLKKFTSQQNESYCEKLKRTGSVNVGIATVFVRYYLIFRDPSIVYISPS
jgi:hypothetical protein